MKVWISRDVNDGDTPRDTCVNMTGKEPTLSTEDNSTWVFPVDGGFCGFMHLEKFQEEFGIEVPKGYCKAHELNIKANDD